MTTTPPKRRRWLQFRVKTLLIAVLVLSLPLSWFGMRMERARKQREAVEAIERKGGSVFYEPVKTSVPQWMRGLFGDFFFEDVVQVCPPGDFDDDEATYLKDLADLERLNLYSTQVTDAGLRHFKGLTNLESLSLDDTQVTDAGLEHLKDLANLETLFLYSTQVTPEGVKKLQEALPNCKIEY